MSSTVTQTTTSKQTIPLSPDDDETKIVAHGKLRYIPHGYTPISSPHNFHLPEIAEFKDVRRMPLYSMRPVPTLVELPSTPTAAQLSANGFTALHHPTSLHSAPYTLSSWKDPANLRAIYIPETEAMLKQLTGCKTVVTETILLRSNLWTESDALATHAGHGAAPQTAEEQAEAQDLSDLETGFPQFIGFNPLHGGASPAPKIHLDYAPSGARVHIRNYHPDMTAAAEAIIATEDRLTAAGESLADEYHRTAGPRWALYSIWRPLKPVRRDPLALLDVRTCRNDDYVPVLIKMPYLGDPTRDGQTHESESYLARWRDAHRWMWIDGQKPEEVLVIGLFDSGREHEGQRACGGTLHSSVELEGAEGEEARESLEMRCLAIW